MKPNAWHLVIGLTLWFAWFSATYGGVAAACAVAEPAPAQGAWTWINATVLLLALACTAGFGGAAWFSARGAQRLQADAHARDRFFAHTATALYAVAALSTVLVAMPAVVLPPCV